MNQQVNTTIKQWDIELKDKIAFKKTHRNMLTRQAQRLSLPQFAQWLSELNAGIRKGRGGR